MHKDPTQKPQENDQALNTDIAKEENKADAGWEEVKDKTSGVNRELEKKIGRRYC